MSESCGQEQPKWITTVIVSTALQVGHLSSRPPSDSLGQAGRRISYILDMEIFYSVSMNIVFFIKKMVISLKLLLLGYWFFLCATEFFS